LQDFFDLDDDFANGVASTIPGNETKKMEAEAPSFQDSGSLDSNAGNMKVITGKKRRWSEI